MTGMATWLRSKQSNERSKVMAGLGGWEKLYWVKTPTKREGNREGWGGKKCVTSQQCRQTVTRWEKRKWKTDRQSDKKIQRNRMMKQHSRIQVGWMPVQVRSGKQSRVVEPWSRCPCWHWKSTLLPTCPRTDNTQSAESQYSNANANRLQGSNLKSLEKILHTPFNNYL